MFSITKIIVKIKFLATVVITVNFVSTTFITIVKIVGNLIVNSITSMNYVIS